MLTTTRSWCSAICYAVLIACATPVQLRGQGDEDIARRIADVAAIALDEYGEGVVGGRVVSEAELREARLFLEEARQAAAGLPEPARMEVLPYLEELTTGVTTLRPLAELRHQQAGLRETLARTLGVTLDPMPRSPPSLVSGAQLYGQHCAMCHGDRGAGDGPAAASLDPPPADLTATAALSSSSPVDFFRKLNVGVAGTAMPGFRERLGLDDRWSLALYVSLLRYSAADVAAGLEELQGMCDSCVLWASDFDRTALLTDDSLSALIGSGPAAPSRSAIAFARAAGATEHLGDDPAVIVARTVTRSKSVVAAALSLGSAGDRAAAATLVLDAYLVFEEIEAMVRARNPGVASRVEQAFTQLRGSLLADRAWAEIVAAGNQLDAALDEASAIPSNVSSPSMLFGQSLVIMLREGLEAILIVGALMAFLVRAQAADRKKDLRWGVAAALVASLLTALGFATLFRTATRHQEVIEGVTMLVAALVLFWVSYWLVSKIELRKWQAFVRSKMEQALTSRRALALSAVAFLAVYREGFETVLFYAALFTTSDGSMKAAAGVVAGIVVGLVMLAVVYLWMQRYGVRLKIKPFFVATSAFLFLMAFSFAGQGVAELQDAGLISVTPLDWMPSLPALGIFPTAQTLVSQLLIATALLAALVWVFWLEPRVVSVSSKP
jgi:high-affinity iron transporter